MLNNVNIVEINIPIMHKIQTTTLNNQKWEELCMLIRKPDFMWKEFKFSDIM